MNKNEDLESVIDRYSDMLYKICFLILKNEHDTRDVLQETFLTYYTKNRGFESEEHKKAWLIKVSQNKCKEFLRFHKRHAALPLEEMEETLIITDGLRGSERELLSLVWDLDYKLKSVVILHYIEGYSVNEIASILKMSPAAVKKRLQRAREKLSMQYKGEPAYEK
ncbi:MAG: RNA polymerase sigma factor [Lachnospiraceae bacterium]|jgi:RNA polymerase sigma-70 factor (ECF subfamily)|nr:RNA polymerase sigma factor [Lachnospiraceae bacterium]MCR4696718.1 RNA polymerase sigma factor [Lachnospiraceae bacterium]